MDSLQTILEKSRNGDHKSFEILVNQHQDFAYSIALKVVKDSNTAEEITMDAFLRVYQNLHSIRKPEYFKSWLYKLVFNLSIARKKLKYHEFFKAYDPEIHGEPVNSAGSDRFILDRERAAFIHQAIGMLDDGEALLLSLFHLEECSIEEIVQITSLSKSNVKTRLHRTRKKLKSILTDFLRGEIRSII